MDLYEIWMRIRIFVLIWVIELSILVVSSIVRYWSFIGAVVANNTWALFNGIMPLVICIVTIVIIVRAVIH